MCEHNIVSIAFMHASLTTEMLDKYIPINHFFINTVANVAYIKYKIGVVFTRDFISNLISCLPIVYILSIKIQ